MRLATRLVGLWILVGAYMKLFHGTPADLPAIVRDLPIAIGLTFKLVIAVEFAIGLFALLRPSEGWLPATLLMLVFCAVLGMQINSGAATCGCMGKLFEIAPTIMLAIDAGLLALMLLSAPWREQLNQAQAPRFLIAILALLLAALPWFFDRQSQHDGTPTGKTWVALDKSVDVGKHLVETQIGRALPKPAQINDGLIVIYSDSCEMCRDHLRGLAALDDMDLRIILLKLPVDPEETGGDVVDVKPVADEFLLPGKRENWAVTPPADIQVKDGKVVRMREGQDFEQD